VVALTQPIDRYGAATEMFWRSWSAQASTSSRRQAEAGWGLSFMLARVEPDAAAEERALVAKAQAGDRAALGALLHRHGPVLYRSVLLPRLGSDMAAREALADTYAKVVEHIGRFVWQNVGFYPWLRTVALRVAIDQLRARKRLVLWEADDVEREVDDTQSATPIDDKLGQHRDRQAAKAKVDDALARIHPRYAEAIRLRVLEEQPREDVAAALGVSPATFDVLLHRAVAALRKAIGSPASPPLVPDAPARTSPRLARASSSARPSPDAAASGTPSEPAEGVHPARRRSQR
jgi:RNA polymerase sigma-70 factor (ECF subfamily)